MNVNTRVELRMTLFPSDAISALWSPDFSSSQLVDPIQNETYTL